MSSQPVLQPQNYQWARPSSILSPNEKIGGVISRAAINMLYNGHFDLNLRITFISKHPAPLNAPYFDIIASLEGESGRFIQGVFPCPDDCQYHRDLKAGLPTSFAPYNKLFLGEHIRLLIINDNFEFIGAWCSANYQNMCIYGVVKNSSGEFIHNRNTNASRVFQS